MDEAVLRGIALAVFSISLALAAAVLVASFYRARLDRMEQEMDRMRQNKVRALRILNAVPDEHPERMTRAQVLAMWLAHQDAVLVLRPEPGQLRG